MEFHLPEITIVIYTLFVETIYFAHVDDMHIVMYHCHVIEHDTFCHLSGMARHPYVDNHLRTVFQQVAENNCFKNQEISTIKQQGKQALSCSLLSRNVHHSDRDL